MKLSKARLRQLLAIRAELQRVVEMMKREDMYLATTRFVNIENPNGGDYVIVNPELAKPNDHSVIQPAAISLVNKHMGSDIVGLNRAFALLDQFLNEEKYGVKKAREMRNDT